MVEGQNDLGKPPLEPDSNFAGQFAIRALEETLASGKMVFIPSLRLVITPDRQLKRVEDLTPEERSLNPYVWD